MKDDLHFWDLKLLENGAGSESNEPGEEISGKKDESDATFTEGAKDFAGRFMYKICQAQWDYPHDYFDSYKKDDTIPKTYLIEEGQKDKSIAFWGMRSEDGDQLGRVMLQKTFERPTWNATLAPEDFEHKDWKYSGLWIQYQAVQQTDPADQDSCKLSGPNTVRFEVDCDGEGEH